MTCVLLAEDDSSISEPLARALRREGYDVDVSADGPGTLQAAQAGGIDLIVLDIGLPKLNGLDACRRIRAKAWAKDVVIVAATGWGQDEDRRRSEEAGFDHHLVKPVDAAALGKLAANGSREKRVH